MRHDCVCARRSLAPLTARPSLLSGLPPHSLTLAPAWSCRALALPAAAGSFSPTALHKLPSPVLFSCACSSSVVLACWAFALHAHRRRACRRRACACPVLLACSRARAFGSQVCVLAALLLAR
ncbi:uncharacterized protein C8Q71DRAFT_145666 [Rhodofomes roseus]|uniref:Uncharacterized protein n=1 Tax=Rhodofomes roseus TaxID=34475 RepID=A0ABQ8KAI6_9APHY|nr:uncharacterized protein C8Q71DRAFT_145666 [Rhodofomes roseus]KAH9834510.1 hypothetical protein C8Q71DRAFT_145666 [Rhodofomes roseus]